MTVIIIGTVVAVVLLLPALTFRWTGHWWCTPDIRPEPVRARELESSDARP